MADHWQGILLQAQASQNIYRLRLLTQIMGDPDRTGVLRDGVVKAAFAEVTIGRGDEKVDATAQHLVGDGIVVVAISLERPAEWTSGTSLDEFVDDQE